MSTRRDHLGDAMPPGYAPWSCHVCTAVCNYEAMVLCAKRGPDDAQCGFDADRPESNGGAFGFIVRDPNEPTEET